MSDPTRAELEAREQARVAEVLELDREETALEKALEDNRRRQQRTLGALTELRAMLGKDALGNELESAGKAEDLGAAADLDAEDEPPAGE